MVIIQLDSNERNWKNQHVQYFWSALLTQNITSSFTSILNIWVPFFGDQYRILWCKFFIRLRRLPYLSDDIYILNILYLSGWSRISWPASKILFLLWSRWPTHRRPQGSRRTPWWQIRPWIILAEGSRWQQTCCSIPLWPTQRIQRRSIQTTQRAPIW